MEKYFFNNCWWTRHPTINFFTFEAYCIKAFGHKCIVEHVQDGEIWSDEEYWGTIFYDFENDRYTYMSTYLNNGNEIERILTRWMNNKENQTRNYAREKEEFPSPLCHSRIQSLLDYHRLYPRRLVLSRNRTRRTHLYGWSRADQHMEGTLVVRTCLSSWQHVRPSVVEILPPP